eukprot:6723508-Karenia_brevis.AAC.1
MSHILEPVCIGRRSRGSLTGSGTAGSCAKVPVLETIATRHKDWEQWAVKLHIAARSIVDSYVDVPQH